MTRLRLHVRFGALRMLLVLAGAASLPLSALAQSADVDWASFADEETVQVVTRDEDGDERETKIWLLVMDDTPYVRTGNTRWGHNAVRDPEFALEIDDEQIPVRGELVSDEATREQVQQGFREKHGFMDWLTGLVRSGSPKIFRLTAR